MIFRPTEDLTCAAVLIHSGHELRGVESNGGSRVSFCFDDSEAVRATIAKFRAGQCKVEPQQFAATIRMLRGAAREESSAKMRGSQHGRAAR